MITWCGDPGWAAWMTGGRSPAARWARRRLCEAERDAAVIEHAALRIRLDAEFLAARCLDVRIALLTVDAEDLIASAGGCGDRLRRGGRRRPRRSGAGVGPGRARHPPGRTRPPPELAGGGGGAAGRAGSYRQHRQAGPVVECAEHFTRHFARLFSEPFSSSDFAGSEGCVSRWRTALTITVSGHGRIAETGLLVVGMLPWAVPVSTLACPSPATGMAPAVSAGSSAR